jgi:hypothetical protein
MKLPTSEFDVEPWINQFSAITIEQGVVKQISEPQIDHITARGAYV